MMKTRVMESVHDLLQQSGQSVPAKHLSIGKRSIQIYDVEHWPESFNSLLLHDIPSIVISIDSSTASLSGFVVTLHWKPSVDMSQCVGIFVHCLLLCCVIVFFVNLSGIHRTQLNKSIRISPAISRGPTTKMYQGPAHHHVNPLIK